MGGPVQSTGGTAEGGAPLGCAVPRREEGVVAGSDAARREGAYFDALVREEGEFNPFTERGWGTIGRAFREMAGVEAGRKVTLLDVGCGTGQSRRVYESVLGRYVGIDLSLGALRRARGNCRDLLAVKADACGMPFGDDTFDVVAFSSVLHHIEDFSPAVAEARRVVRPGGVVFAYDPSLLHPGLALLRHPRSPFYLSQGVSPNERPLMPGALRRAFAGAGLVGVKQRQQADVPFRAVAPRLIHALLDVYNAGDWVAARLGLGRWFGAFTITVGWKER